MANYSWHPKRGIRNNNPGNIVRNNRVKWVGQSPVQNDPKFVQFTDAVYGIRALYRNLLTYRKQYGLNTIKGIIEKWAPPHENNTKKYIAAVSKTLGISPITPLTAASQYLPIVKTIIFKENSVVPYSDPEILMAMRLALSDN